MWIGAALLAGCLVGAAGIRWLRGEPVASNLPAHLALPLFAQGTFNSGFGPMVLSPSGASVVFPVSENSGVRRLWLRSLPSMNAIALAGTEMQDSPLVAGRRGDWVFRQRKAEGVPAERRDHSRPLRRASGPWRQLEQEGRHPVHAAGSERTSVPRRCGRGNAPACQTLDSSRKEIDHRWPEFLKDGRHFVYTVQRRRRNTRDLSGDARRRRACICCDRTLSQALYADTPDGSPCCM